MSTTYSGKYAQVDFGSSAYAEAQHWTFERTADTQQWGSFGGGGFKDAAAGQRSGRGTVEGKYDFADPLENLVKEGDSVTLKLYLTKTGSGAAADRYWTVPAVITDISEDAEGDAGDPVSFSLSFVTKGGWTEP